MRYMFYCLTLLFFIFVISAPLRIAYAAAPQTDPTRATTALSVTSVPAPPNAPLQSTPEVTSSLNEPTNAWVPSPLLVAARSTTNATIAASQSVVNFLSFAFSQTASAWSAWVLRANTALNSKVEVPRTPSTAAVVVSQTGSNAPPISATLSTLPTSRPFSLSGASSDQSNSTYTPRTAGVVLGTSTAANGYVSQGELSAQLQQTENSLRSLIYQNESVSGSVYATGGYNNEIAVTNDIDQLNGTTLTNVIVNGVSGLTATEIPTDIVAANYLPLTGGTLSGALIDSSTATSTFAGALGIGTTSPAQALSVAGRIYAAGGIQFPDGSVQTAAAASAAAGTQGQLAYYAASGSTLSGTSTLLLSPAGNVGIGTTTPGSLLSLGGVANFTAATSTFYGAGISISGGCFAINGTCISAGSGAQTNTANTYTALQQFSAGASTTQTSAYAGAYFGATATSSFNATGQLTLAGISNALLFANSSGGIVGTTTLAVNVGGTGSTTLGGLLTGNGTGALTAATITAPLFFSGNTLSISQANSTSNGYLSQTDWNTFNSKISSTSLSSANGYLTYNPATGVFIASTSPTYVSATSTNFFASNLTVGSLSGLLKGTSGVISVATAGTDYLTGSGTSGDCVQWGASNTLTDSGASCGTGSTSFAYPFPNNATSTTLTFGGGLIAGSSTIGTLNATSSVLLASTTLSGNTLLSNATSSTFAITGISNTLLKTLTDGAVVAALAGTDYITPSGLSSAVASAYPFQLFGNATSTLTQFNGGLTAYASSTIGNGTAGLTINGAATTTGNAYFAGNVGIGSSTPNSALSLTGGNYWQTPGTPVLVGQAAAATFTGALYIQGHYAYLDNLTVGPSMLQIYDITNPASPQLVGSYFNTGNGIQDVVVSGKYAYFSTAGNACASPAPYACGILVLDVSNPSSPKFVGTGGASGTGLALSGKYAYAAGGGSPNAMLYVNDISNPAAPALVGSVAGQGGTAVSVYVSGSYAYVVGSQNTSTERGLNIIDVSNPTNPVIVGSASTTETARSVYVSGKYAYVGELVGTGNFQIFDISNPAAPVAVGSLTANSGLSSVYVSGNYAYLIGGTPTSSLQIVNITNPDSPTLVTAVNLPATAGNNFGHGIKIVGKYAYLGENAATTGNSFQIFDISGIQAPAASIGNIDTSDLTVDEDANIGGDLYLNGGINAGISGIFSRGTISSYVASSTEVNPVAANFMGGDVAVGTTSPYALLSVWGQDAASSTLAFNIVNSASTTVLAVFDGGNAQLSGTLTQSSDQRLKTNIQSLDASSTLALIEQLNPVTFNWIDPDEGSTTQLGFIAQQVQQVFPNLVSTTSATALTPDGTLGLNYIGLIAPLVSAVQEIGKVSGAFEQNMIAWLGSATNGIEDLYASTLHANELCLSDSSGTSCYTRSQLDAAFASFGQSPSLAPAAVITTSTALDEAVTGSNASTTATDDTGATSTPSAPSIVPEDASSTTATSSVQ